MKLPFTFLRYLLPLWLLVAAACHKADPTPAPPPLTTSIILAEPVVPNDTTAALSWTLLNNPNFVRYYLMRREDPAEQGYRIYTSPTITSGAYTDKALPYNDYVEYQVFGELATGQLIASNIVSYRRPRIKPVMAGVFHVLFEEQSRTLLFFTDKGTLTQVDAASGQVRRTLELGPVGYASFGTYQGTKELYVPGADGQIRIYNAATLDKLEEITTGGYYLNEVLATNGLLYVCSRYSSPISQLAVFDRASKQLLTKTGSVLSYSIRMYGLPTQPNSFIGVTISGAPPDQATYDFSAAGEYLRSTPDRYHGDHPLDGLLFAFFPTGDRYLTGAQGGIYSQRMEYLTSLDGGKSNFACYGFDAAAGVIYAGSTKPLVQLYDLTTYAPLRQLKLPLYPFKLFKDPAGGFVCLGLRNPVENYFYGSSVSSPAKIYIEHLD